MELIRNLEGKRMNRVFSRGIIRRFSVRILGDDAAFVSVHKAAGKKILYFTAAWCPPCKMMAPVFERLSKAHAGISFLKIDVDTLGGVAQDFNIRSVPTFIFMNNQKEIAKFAGASEELLNKHILELEKVSE